MTSRLTAQVRAEIMRIVGRSYRIKFEALDEESLCEVIRLLRDLEHEKQGAIRRAQLTPWRRPG